MKCAEFRQRLLGSDDLGLDDAACRAHLLECAECRGLRRQLAQIEAHVPLIPVPPSRGAECVKAALFGMTRPRPASPPTARSPWPRRILHAAIAASALAILVLVGVYVGEWASRLAGPIARTPNPPLPVPPAPVENGVPRTNSPELARRILDCNLQLAQTRDPQERVEILGRIADILNSETPTLVKEHKAKDLHAVAELYGRVVKDGIVRRAQTLPAEKGRETLRNAALKLELSSRANSELARASGPEMASALDVMARTSRDAASALRELAKEGAQ